MKTKAERVATLVTNCSCLEGKEAVLNGLDDAVLSLLEKKHEQDLFVANVRREFGLGADVTLNAMPAALAAAKKKKAGCSDDEEEEDMPPTKNFLSLPREQRLTSNELAALDFAEEMRETARKRLVDQLVTANASNDEARKAIRPIYEGMAVKQLRTLVAALPNPSDRRQTRNASDQADFDTILDYSGAGAGAHRQVNNGLYGLDTPNPDDVLEPTYNWEREEAKRKAAEAAKK